MEIKRVNFYSQEAPEAGSQEQAAVKTPATSAGMAEITDSIEHIGDDTYTADLRRPLPNILEDETAAGPTGPGGPIEDKLGPVGLTPIQIPRVLEDETAAAPTGLGGPIEDKLGPVGLTPIQIPRVLEDETEPVPTGPGGPIEDIQVEPDDYRLAHASKERIK